MVGPLNIIGSILFEQFMGPCEPIGTMSKNKKWAHSLSLVVFCLSNFWAHVTQQQNVPELTVSPGYSLSSAILCMSNFWLM
jgi:hypothetical protein